MDFKTYQKKARETAQYPNLGSNNIYPTLGLVGEAGEVAEKVKKVIRDKNGIFDNESKLGIKKELGDVLWYISNLCTELNFNLEDVALQNLEKLNDFKDNDTVNLDSLVKKGLIFKPKFPLKILGNGKINVKLKVQAHAFTKVAKQKIEDAGGSCELINNK